MNVIPFIKDEFNIVYTQLQFGAQVFFFLFSIVLHHI